MASKRWTALALIFLLASVAVITAIAIIQGHKRIYESPGLKYGIVIDSGSSRSTMYLYQWPAEKENNTGVVSQNLKCDVHGPGISDMGVNKTRDDESWKSIRACMDNITKLIPHSLHNATPVFLGATAGMRLLHSQDETRSNKILSKLQSYLRSLPFNFQNASIISGEEEGLYGWITVNYLMGNFLEKSIWNAWVHPHGSKTVGSMDLGGASTQIAFTVPEESRGQDYMKVSLYGYEYNVYTHSFLCYGKNEAEKRVMASIVENSNNPTEVLYPCYPRGFNYTVTAEFIYGTECTKTPVGYDPKKNITLVGTSESVLCRNAVRNLFNLTCRGNISFNCVHQPPVSGDFMAYAGFYYSAAALYLKGSSTIEQWRNYTDQFCSWDWSTLKKERVWIRERFLKGYCYSIHYVATILVDGYKFDDETWKNIMFQKEVHNTSIGWSLGYMLDLSSMIPAEAKLVHLPMTNSVFGGLIFLFSAVTIISVMFLLIMLVRACY